MNDQKMADLGEGGLLELMGPLFRQHTRNFPLPTGDDVAISPPLPPGCLPVWTIDSMVEGTHFRWWDNPQATAAALGTKLVASNLSDLASKGATPAIALLSLGVPSTAPVSMIADFLGAVAYTLGIHGASLAGGDTVAAPVWCLTLSLLGILPPDATIAARHRARPGQSLYITGCPGESGAGFHCLEQGVPSTGKSIRHVVSRHLRPTPRVALGSRLIGIPDIAMIDVSDGLVHEAEIMARQSAVGVVLERDAIPLSPQLVEVAPVLGRDPLGLALHGGEDYELLFATAAPVEKVLSIDPLIRRIGKITEGGGVRLEGPEGLMALSSKSFEHFQSLREETEEPHDS